MSAYEKYVQAFRTTMGIDEKGKLETLKYQDVEAIPGNRRVGLCRTHGACVGAGGCI